jgi:hypothetical protein
MRTGGEGSYPKLEARETRSVECGMREAPRGKEL